MARIFICYNGDSVYAAGVKLFQVKQVLEAPFHVTIKPCGENVRRFDINENKTIPVTKNEVMMKVGEPLMIDPDYSVMVTRIFNNEQAYCRVSVRCPPNIDLRKK